jgi:peptide/nickel transport system permease protein
MAKKNKNAEETVSSENAIESRETAGLSQGQIVRRRFVHHRAAMASVIILGLVILFVFSASGIHLGTKENPIEIPGWWRYSMTDIMDKETVGCPEDLPGCITANHPFGQDDIGKDYFALVMRGAQQSIMVMLVVGAIATFIGTVLGAIAGFRRGVIDTTIMWITTFVSTIPTIILAAVLGKRFGNLGVVVLAVFLGLLSWTGLTRLVRGEFLGLREREFVDAARVAGASNRRIIFKHILPNAVGVIIVSVTLLMSGAILLESALSFLGFGVTAPDVSLGSLISQYQSSFNTRPWLFWYPGAFIIIIALCVNFIGDGLRDAFDPRQKRRISAKERAQAAMNRKNKA